MHPKPLKPTIVIYKMMKRKVDRGMEPLDARTDPRTRLKWWLKNKKKLKFLLSASLIFTSNIQIV
jgi:hypothetical protein